MTQFRYWRVGAAALAFGVAFAPMNLFGQQPMTSGPQDQQETQASPEDDNGERLEFTHVLDDSALDVHTARPGEEFTEAVEEFHRTGENPYSGDGEAVTDGQSLYNQWCQACHMPDGSGRMGPALNDETVRYERAATDKGEFEIIYGGAAGAMQPFGDRMTQDEILRLMAFTETLRPPH